MEVVQRKQQQAKQRQFASASSASGAGSQSNYTSFEMSECDDEAEENTMMSEYSGFLQHSDSESSSRQSSFHGIITTPPTTMRIMSSSSNNHSKPIALTKEPMVASDGEELHAKLKAFADDNDFYHDNTTTLTVDDAMEGVDDDDEANTSEKQDEFYLLKPLHTIPPRELIKELVDRPKPEELDHIVLVPRQVCVDGTTTAMISIVEEMKKQEKIQHLAEIRFVTELSLTSQGFPADMLFPTLTLTSTNTSNTSNTINTISSSSKKTNYSSNTSGKGTSTSPNTLLTNPLAFLTNAASLYH